MKQLSLQSSHTAAFSVEVRDAKKYRERAPQQIFRT